MQAVVDIYAVWNRRVSTNPLNRWFEDAVSSHPPPAVSGRRLKLNYITQVKSRPPSFVLFCSRADAMPESYLRYLVHGLRDRFDLPGTPIRITLREKDNPFAAREEEAAMTEPLTPQAQPREPSPRARSCSSSSPCCSTCWRSASSFRCCRAWWSVSWAATRAGAAEVLGMFGTAWALMQFLFSPVIGALSDRFGRRPVILMSNLGLGLDYVLMALAPRCAWLFVGRVISGITAASISTGFAYVADVTPPEQRAARFGMLGVAFGAGFVLGPAIGGLAGQRSIRACRSGSRPASSLANALYGWLILPESLAAESRMPFAWRRANPLGALKLLRSHRELFGLASVNFLGMLAHAVLPIISVLYMLYRYGWDERAVGFVMAGVGICCDGGAGRPDRPGRSSGSASATR